MRIAIDTTCLIGALTRPSSASGRLLQAWLNGELEVVASEATVREAELVLGGGWLSRIVRRERVEEVLEALRTRTVWVDRPQTILDLALKDEGDLRMVETAVSGAAAYIVTTDREFLSRRGYNGVEFVTPGEIVGSLSSE